MSVLKIKNELGEWEQIGTIKGDNAVINGYDVLNIVEGTGIDATQVGDTLTISAPDSHTHSNKTALDNVGGTNTGDEDATSIKTKLGITTLSGSNTGDETNQTIKTKLGITTLSGSNTGDQDLSGLVPKTTTINGKSLSADVSLSYSDVGAEPLKGTDDNFVTDTEKANLHAPHSDDQDLSGLVPKTTTVNNKALNGNISLDYSDVGAEPAKGADDNYVTDTEKSALHGHSNKTALDNVSGTNTGDETDSTIKTKLGITTLSGSNTGDETNLTIKDKLGTDLTGKIPYTGATTDTDLGTKNLTTTGNITGNLRGGAEVTVANKHKYYPLVSDIVGSIIAKRFTYYWNGSAYATDYSNGFGQSALYNNTGSYSNGFGQVALHNNTGYSSNGFGFAALYNNTESYSNGFGYLALRYNQKSNNTAVGNSANSAFLDNTSGNKTTAYTNVNDTTDRITITSHGFGATNAYVNIKYASTTGTAIGGLTVGGIYQIKIIDANTIGFYEGSRGTNITSQGTGDHTFTPQYAYTNTTCLGANTSPTADNQVVLGDANVTQIKLGAGTSATQIVQEAWIEPTLLNGWVNFDAGANYAVCGYYKDSTGVIRIKGMVKDGTLGQPIFTLPTGYRPSKIMYFAGSSNVINYPIDIIVTSAGSVYTNTAVARTWVAFNLSFRAE